MPQVEARDPARHDWAVIIGLSVGALAFHLLVNAFGGYGIFRDEVTLVAVHTCRYCMPYENDMPIYVCRGLRVSPAEIWKNERPFN